MDARRNQKAQKSVNLQLQKNLLQKNLLQKVTHAARRAANVQHNQRVQHRQRALHNQRVRRRAAVMLVRVLAQHRAGSDQVRLHGARGTAVPVRAQIAVRVSRRIARQPAVAAVAPVQRAVVLAIPVISRLLVRVLPIAAVAVALRGPAPETATNSRPHGRAPAVVAVVRVLHVPVQATARRSRPRVHVQAKAAGVPVQRGRAAAVVRAVSSRTQVVLAAVAPAAVAAQPLLAEAAIREIVPQRTSAVSL